MRTTRLAAGFAVAAMVLVSGFASAGAGRGEGTHGRMLPPDDETLRGRDEVGYFRMYEVERGSQRDAREFERVGEISVKARGLYVPRNNPEAREDQRPSYHLWAVTPFNNNDAKFSLPAPNTRTEVDFGPLVYTGRGQARLTVHKPHEIMLLQNLFSMREFIDGTVEIRDGSTVILTADVGDFSHRTRSVGPGPRVRGSSRLEATRDGGLARGRVTASYARDGQGSFDAIHIRCDTLGEAGDTFYVTVIDAQGNESFLGSFRTERFFGGRTFRSNSVGRFDATNEDRIQVRELSESGFPEGGVRSLSGGTVEIRDGDGVAFLRGPFPEFPDLLGR